VDQVIYIMKKLLILISFLLLTGCTSNDRYELISGGRYPPYVIDKKTGKSWGLEYEEAEPVWVPMRYKSGENASYTPLTPE